MLSREEAIARVKGHLVALEPGVGVELALLEQNTLEEDFGWVFFYQSKDFLESGRVSDKLAGNSPIIVDRRDGTIHTTGTAHPIESYVSNYRRYGSPYPPR